MDLSKFKFPEISQLDMAFSTLETNKELLTEAMKRDVSKGENKFNQLFYNGGNLLVQDDYAGSWKENALRYAIALMRSFNPKHEHKTAVCAMIFQECLILE